MLWMHDSSRPSGTKKAGSTFNSKGLLIAVSLTMIILLQGLLEATPAESSEEDATSVEKYPTPAPTVPTTRAGPQAPTVLGLLYAAIGPSEFRDTAQPLIDWKTQKGVKARYFSFDSDEGFTAFPGRDLQESVRNFIASLKENNPSLRWLVLVGDGDVIPPRNIFINGSAQNGTDDPSNFILSDYYYVGLNSTWDTNGNGVFGEDDHDEYDWFPALYLGRLPASDVEELEWLVEKQLRYERDPPPGNWSRSALLVGSLMDRPNTPNNPSTPLDEGFDAYKDNAHELIRRIREDLPEHMITSELYDYELEEYGGYNQLFDILNRSSFTSHFEMGFSTALLACHGDNNGNCTHYIGESGGNRVYWGDAGPYFDYEDAENVRNGERLPLVYISSCASLNFSEKDDTNMERVLRNQNGGAIAIIGASKDTYRGEYMPEENYTSSYGNWWEAQEFFRLLYGGHPRPGEAFYEEKWNYIEHVFTERDYNIEEFRMFYNNNLAYNLLGDPEGPIWTDVPRRLDVRLPEPFLQDNTTFKATVLDRTTGIPVKNAVLTILDPDDPAVYFVNRSNLKGEVRINLRLSDLGTVLVTVAADGYVPSENEVRVISGWNVMIDPEVQLTPDPPTSGKPVEMAFTIRNTGRTAIHYLSVNATLRPLYGDLAGVNETRLIQYLGPQNSSVLRFKNPQDPDRAKWKAYEGMNLIEVKLEIIGFPYKESNTQDNYLAITFQANEEIRVGPFPSGISILEDTSLSEHYGRLNISSYLRDKDQYPQNIRAWVEPVFGNVNATLSSGMVLDVVPAKDWNGEAVLNISASDGLTAAWGAMNLTVLPVNDPPEFLNVPNEIEAVEDRPFNFSIEVLDVDSDRLDVSIGEVDFTRNHSVHGNVHTINLSFSPDNSLLGESKLTITASDDAGASTEWGITLRVDPSNDPPVVIPPVKITVEAGKRASIDLDIKDEDGDRVFRITGTWQFGSYEWNTTTISFRVNKSVREGTYPFDLVVDDGRENGTTRVRVLIEVVSGRDKSTTYIVGIIIIMLLAILIAYGVVSRVRELKQRKLLEEVGTDIPLEVRSVSEVVKNTTSIPAPTDEAIQVPPAPPDIEGNLARKEMVGLAPPVLEEPAAPKDDIDSDLEEMIGDLLQ